MYIENIVVGKPIYDEKQLLSINEYDWEFIEKEKTVYDEERSLPRLLVKYGFTTSTSEIRRNRSDLVKMLDKPDFLEIKLGKKKIWIIVGE
jgi:hypothetical protein